MYTGGVLTKTHMHQSKTQFYSGDGTGRDTYIQGNNGGFCPATQPTKIEELGKIYFEVKFHYKNSYCIHDAVYLNQDDSIIHTVVY